MDAAFSYSEITNHWHWRCGLARDFFFRLLIEESSASVTEAKTDFQGGRYGGLQIQTNAPHLPEGEETEFVYMRKLAEGKPRHPFLFLNITVEGC